MPTTEQIQLAISSINDQTTFIQNLLIGALGWRISHDVEDIDSISYQWELGIEGLSRDIVDGQIKQIQPIVPNQIWAIFVLEFTNESIFTRGRGLTGLLRKILSRLISRRFGANMPDWHNILFICTHRYRHFRFAHFKATNHSASSGQLITFGWNYNDSHIRTLCQFNLPALAWPDEDITSEQWVKQWSEAFNVEQVTNKFYEAYETAFDDLQEQVVGLSDEEDKKFFVQTLMNRLLFLRFVEKKGWLRFGDETRPQNYLQRLFRAGPIGNQSWYNSRLKVLFFEGMAIPNHRREDIIGQVPYLNGGLFEKIPRLDDQVTDIPHDVFESILGEDGLFYKFNFTVEESTPLNIDVAVDPEMLGKVFEKLVTDRRDTGSYYTPRTIVSFMCREAIKGYLGSPNAPFIDERKAEYISVPEAKDLLQKFDNVKIVDPACGSGAYLLGMLHELYDLTSLLDTRARTQTPKDAYHRKLSIIQNNLYGVDLDDFAVNIARLRLWLSLAVEFEGDTPEPLPNLDFKIESGDSLTSPDPSGGIEPGLHRELMKRYVTLRKQYLNPPPTADKGLLLRRIEELKTDIVGWLHSSGPVMGFDWQAEFLEVFIDSGFDIVLANPPYGASVEDHVHDLYFNKRNANEKGQSKDTYGLFIARGLQLLKPGGYMSYIVSDTWRTIKTHRPLRRRLLNTTSVVHILDLPSWIFDAMVNTCIVNLSKRPAVPDHNIIAGDLHAIETNNWKALGENLVAIANQGIDIQTETYARYTYAQSLISNYDNVPVLIGSPKLYTLMSDDRFTKVGNLADVKVGLQTGDNEYYIRKRQGARGGYEIVDGTLVLTEEELENLTDEEKQDGVNPQDYEGRHFVPYDKGGASDTEEGWLPNYYVPTGYFIDWSQDAVHRLYTATIADVKERRGQQDQIRASDRTTRAAVIRNPSFYFQKGITFSDTGMYSPSFRQSCGSVFDQKGSVIIPNDPEQRDLLLGLLCSVWARYVYKVYVNHTVSSHVDSIKEFPCVLNDEQIAEIKTLVAQIITNQKADLTYPYQAREQKQIDTLVYQSYGLDENDIREIELWYCRRYRRLAEAQGLLAEVREKYAAHLERCKRVLEKPPSYWRSNPILQLIAQGESHTLEFKETLEYDVRENRQNRELNKATLKTIAAFLNADGGTLLIGVSDAGEVKGITRDLQFVRGNNRDGFEQKLRSLINDYFDPSPLGNVEIRFEDLQEGTVCQINVEKSSEPVAYDKDFYIRDGNGTRKLEGRDVVDWLRQRNNS